MELLLGLLGLLAFMGAPLLYSIFFEKTPKIDKFYPSYHQDIDLAMSKEDIIERYGKEYWLERYGKKKKKKRKRKDD